MLKTRVITALVLLAALLPVLYFGNFLAFAAIASVFFGAAIWECQRLFKKPLAIPMSAIWVAVFVYYLSHLEQFATPLMLAIVVALWWLRMVPLLKKGLPDLQGYANGMLSTLYGLSVFACFAAIAILFQYSTLFLLSAMALVWIADIGAYFAGKAFGKHKLAPSISPGKSWEGAIGGWLAVLLIAGGSTQVPELQNTFPAQMLARHGWAVLLAVLTLICVASVIGDLFESMLKRRVGMKDSSQLLPGHGGVLDRIDALIPVLPLAALLQMWH